MQQSVFITGNSSGPDYGLTEEYLHRGCQGLEGNLHDIRGAGAMPTPHVAAKAIIETGPCLMQKNSGDFVDIKIP